MKFSDFEEMHPYNYIQKLKIFMNYTIKNNIIINFAKFERKNNFSLVH